MKYKTLKKIIGKKSSKYDSKKWNKYVEQDKMCFIVPPILFLVCLIIGIVFMNKGQMNYSYIAFGLALFFGFRYTYKMNGACKASKR